MYDNWRKTQYKEYCFSWIQFYIGMGFDGKTCDTNDFKQENQVLVNFPEIWALFLLVDDDNSTKINWCNHLGMVGGCMNVRMSFRRPS